MAGSRIELLVHAGAPGSRMDDKSYTAQAQAYLDFEGTTVLQVTPSSQDRRAAPSSSSGRFYLPDVEGKPSRADAVIDENMNQDFSPSMFLGDTQDAITALESQLVTSPLESLRYSPSQQKLLVPHPGSSLEPRSIPQKRSFGGVESHQFAKSPHLTNWIDDSAAYDLGLIPAYVPPSGTEVRDFRYVDCLDTLCSKRQYPLQMHGWCIDIVIQYIGA